MQTPNSMLHGATGKSYRWVGRQAGTDSGLDLGSGSGSGSGGWKTKAQSNIDDLLVDMGWYKWCGG